MNLLKWFVIWLAVCQALTALGCVVLLILSYRRDPPSCWVRKHIPEPDSPKWREPQKASRR
jgi:hypothetical protein